jgi:outer membrane protein OmpA-like peptidoglycan-associated protein
MKLSPLFCRAFVTVYLLSCFDLSATHYKLPADTLPNYVVIGAFAKQRNAVRFTAHANKELKLQAHFEINPNRNLYYVYCLTTANTAQAIDEAKRLRTETVLQDAWVFKGILGEGMANTKSVDINPITNRAITIEASEEKVDDTQQTETTEVEHEAITTTNQIPNNTIASQSAGGDGTIAKESSVSQLVSEQSDVEGKNFVFKLSRFVDQVEVKGDVDIIDPDKAKKVASYEGNRPVRVSTVKNKSGKITVATEVFGYRKMQRDFDYNNPIVEDIVSDEAGNIVVPFELVRLQKGDFAIMYNVYFFRDAAIMRPESRYEVGSLLEMLRENPKYLIKIHGHTNGNHSGRIIYRDEKVKEFFSINGSKDGYGSAKELSRARAEEIREFLIAEGVDPARTSVKAWGGKKEIHDKHSARAQENVRVEIEILEDK